MMQFSTILPKSLLVNRVESPLNKGFHIETLPEMYCAQPEKQLTHSEVPSLFARVWTPSQYDESTLNGRFVRTVISLKGEETEIEVDCESLVDRCELIGNPISYAEAEIACKTNSLKTFISRITKPIDAAMFSHVRDMEQLLCWHRYINWIKAKKVHQIVGYICDHLPEWKKKLEEEMQVYIPETEEIRYPFELLRNGNLWMHFSYRFLEEIQPLTINLQTGEVCQWMRFDEEVGKKIRKFTPLFKKNPGLPLFFDFFQRSEKTRSGENSFFVCKCALSDGTLYTNTKKFIFSENWEIAFQLLRGLEILEKDQIVHCGIYPSSISLTYHSAKVVEATFGNFDYAYPLSDLPKNFVVPYKWKNYIPPETSIERLPFAIPIRQLGLCFKELFGTNPPLSIAAMIEGMTQPNPELRWSPALALRALCDPFQKEI